MVCVPIRKTTGRACVWRLRVSAAVCLGSGHVQLRVTCMTKRADLVFEDAYSSSCPGRCRCTPNFRSPESGCSHFVGDCVVAISSQVHFFWDLCSCTRGAGDKHFHKDLTQFQWSAWTYISCFLFVNWNLQNEASVWSLLCDRSRAVAVPYLLGLLAMIKCSICSYQCDN